MFSHSAVADYAHLSSRPKISRHIGALDRSTALAVGVDLGRAWITSLDLGQADSHIVDQLGLLRQSPDELRPKECHRNTKISMIQHHASSLPPTRS